MVSAEFQRMQHIAKLRNESGRQAATFVVLEEATQALVFDRSYRHDGKWCQVTIVNYQITSGTDAVHRGPKTQYNRLLGQGRQVQSSGKPACQS